MICTSQRIKQDDISEKKILITIKKINEARNIVKICREKLNEFNNGYYLFTRYIRSFLHRFLSIYMYNTDNEYYINDVRERDTLMRREKKETEAEV